MRRGIIVTRKEGRVVSGKTIAGKEMRTLPMEVFESVATQN